MTTAAIGRTVAAGSPRALPAVLAGASIAGGLVAGELAAAGRTGAVLGLVVLIVPVVLWKKPQLGAPLVLLTGLTIEQFSVGGRNGPITDRIPLFHGLSGAHITPADLLLLFVLAVSLLRRRRESRLPRSATSACVLALLGAVVLGLLIGAAHHADLRVALMETRPYIYLAATYVLAASFVSSRTLLRAMLWILVLGSGFKAMQGFLLYASVGRVGEEVSLLGHEEALFFGIFVLLTLGLWLFGIKGALRTTATALLPVVLAADLANGRRTAWLVLGAGIAAMAVIVAVVMPERRRLVMQIGASLALAAVLYLPVYWNAGRSLAGQPARAIRSMISPSARDASSDLYRRQENANLRVNIGEGGLLGRGFGVPIDSPFPIADIRDIDPMIVYVPHNGVLYVLMRMGLLGAVALWTLMASGLIAGCRLARSRDRELAVVGALIACALIGYALQGYNDHGFFVYRVAFVIGSLLGLGEAARRLARST
jgi:hypothetical protein